jgi:hypothetical protein
MKFRREALCELSQGMHEPVAGFGKNKNGKRLATCGATSHPSVHTCLAYYLP